MTENKKIAVVGAGIVGLSTALWLQGEGFQVTLIDRDEPGMGASFGNAGLFADYARLPFARFAMLCKMPNLLLDKESPLSLQSSYLPSLLPYGVGFVRACFPNNFRAGCQALTSLQEKTRVADQYLLKKTQADSLVKSEGCLGLFASPEGFAKAQEDDLEKRREQGVNLQLLKPSDIKGLEPDIADFYAGGVYYPDTRFTVDPLKICQKYAQYFLEKGGVLLRDEVLNLQPSVLGSKESVRLKLSHQTVEFDQVVITAGVASKALLKPLSINLPLVSERGYHLSLDIGDKHLTRPVGWLDKGVFLTPMADGVRMAGTAEFAKADAPENHQCTDTMFSHATTMLGQKPEMKSTWVGSRPSTPDSLPVIGRLQKYPQVTLAFGHSHLGLTLGALTGQLVCELLQNKAPSVDLAPFAPERF